MRKLAAIAVLILTVIVIMLLDRPMGSTPALGRLLDPVNGCWANAESVNKNYNLNIPLSVLQEPVIINFDNRLVPHIRAGNPHDIYVAQGYVHAYFRLWQMDLQTRAAAGRVSEVLGDKALQFDRGQRRKGMVYGAENSLKAMEADPRTKLMLDAYTAGVNSYIATLKPRMYPLEYKLMGFAPERWTNIKSALLLKYMADDLTGETDDIALTVLKGILSQQELDYLYPEKIAGSTPIIPATTSFQPATLRKRNAPPDSVAFAKLHLSDFKHEREDGKGSNNWALSGGRTANGSAILCNDPHLGLNLPSLWFEVQLQTPFMNVYGVSLPGAPGVVIGFNNNISWGLTNNYRDVKDFYTIDQSSPHTYIFGGKELSYTERVERIGVKDKPDYYDTVKYTVHGPVIYDETFAGPDGLTKPLALSWMAHRKSNELLALYMLNRSNNYPEFVAAIQYFKCPAQNMIYADRKGNIAIWGQGQFINKWNGQGKYVMNGTDSSTLWRELIPVTENPHALNPQQGYLSSANQSVTNNDYPYWYNGSFVELRAWRINEVLGNMHNATVKDMFALQNDTYSILAANILPVMLQYINTASLQGEAKQYADSLAVWNYTLTAHSQTTTVFQLWWARFYKALWNERFSQIPEGLLPAPERTMQLLQIDTALIARAVPILQATYRQTIDTLATIKNKEWYHVKNTSVRHLTKIPSFGFDDLEIGGWGNTVNAMKGTHGPSWRMVVQMGNEIEAYGVYPGGQSGNPGSKYYATFLNKWAGGEYYKLLFLSAIITPQQKEKIKYTWNIQP
jgi:penicillin G amidase